MQCYVKIPYEKSNLSGGGSPTSFSLIMSCYIVCHLLSPLQKSTNYVQSMILVMCDSSGSIRRIDVLLTHYVMSTSIHDCDGGSAWQQWVYYHQQNLLMTHLLDNTNKQKAPCPKTKFCFGKFSRCFQFSCNTGTLCDFPFFWDSHFWHWPAGRRCVLV